MRPIPSFGKLLVRKSIFLHLACGSIKDLESGDADGTLNRFFPENGGNRPQCIVISEQRIVIEKDQDGRPGLADRIITSPGDSQVLGCDKIPERYAWAGGNKGLQWLI